MFAQSDISGERKKRDRSETEAEEDQKKRRSSHPSPPFDQSPHLGHFDFDGVGKRSSLQLGHIAGHGCGEEIGVSAIRQDLQKRVYATLEICVQQSICFIKDLKRKGAKNNSGKEKGRQSIHSVTQLQHTKYCSSLRLNPFVVFRWSTMRPGVATIT